MSHARRNTERRNGRRLRGAAKLSAARAAARRPEVLDLRIKGISFREIARRLGVDVAQVHRDYVQAMTELRILEGGLAEEHRDLELARLDAMLARLWKSIDKGKPGAIDVGVRVVKQRAALLSLTVDRHEHTVTAPQVEALLKAVLQVLRRYVPPAELEGVVVELGCQVDDVLAQLVGSDS